MKPTEIADGVREGMETEREPVAEKWVLIDEDAELPENPYKKTFYFNYVRITEAEIAERLYEAYEKGQQSVIDAGFRKVKEAGK